MRGASLISGGGSPQHAALVAAYRADPAARKALDADEDPGALLERLRREPTATGQALNDYLDFVGFRLLDGFDISGRYALEMPDVLLRSISTAIDETGAASDVEAADRRGPQPRSGGAPRGVRRPAGGGPHRLQRARRTRRLQRHLGLRADASRRARGRPSPRGGRPPARRRALRLREHRRDVRAARRCAAPTADELADRHALPPDLHRQGRPAAPGRRPAADAGPVAAPAADGAADGCGGDGDGRDVRRSPSRSTRRR